ncbi:hypothetical protein BPS13_0050 [Bacillus phage BPS13]|uniref:Uncharacterized protein n=2 Tax=Wphvirus BPS13 TaxID=1987727 RepID=A0A173GBB7_9CAUD|nr:hypothetical protein BPS13_0050 [Bacillus phage BPS13]YP_009281978.1 hypothetical protein SALINJAH_24 [Bacillus phage SalinJah]AEZ50229.1 hypothetical protein BPS13_0050 [Bacillus phage BPS13]ANH50671.1 hypothetical protein SALINJAH_24 [Bacillus phage SalinJah]
MNPITFLLVLVGWYILSCFAAYFYLLAKEKLTGTIDIDEQDVFVGGFVIWIVTTIIFIFVI